MIKEFVKKWDKYKKDLEEYFRTTKQEKYKNYEDIVIALFDYVINRDYDYYEYNTSEMDVIEHDEYDGTRIFILHKTNCPDIGDYVYTNTYYGTCPVCDILQSIQSEGLPDEKQIEDYMTLALHLLQKCHYMKD